ncbi:TetR/AcrR family transcriptional regulator [Sporolactobacillus inulinus]|uniref:TetR family transcriptional regulator n=1 Tax=Sporolactobacillus inulinus CASD TaxID=1069536 RepID=A0A0U1QL67_9BACL|nr:TetR/AcrR family transcriptional regulator [Sporolactobacillus inulinus]KLI01491.1 TetR family transcriptional regulator [Sporolactobacillus inulinus CASD]GEB77316.1 TetR family transcriptional regulator [Sporolactobacillus inulinus]
MEESKEKAILTAAIHEFAVKGFDRASTNQIAKASMVSKGLIFHYYESKEKLFEASVNYALEISETELNYTQWNFDGDLIEKLKHYCTLEFKFFHDYPDVYQMLMAAFTRPPKELSDKMTRLLRELTSVAPQFFKKIVTNLDLKEDVDADVLQAVFESHYTYYMTRAMAYSQSHPDSTVEELKPIINQFLAMLKMSLRGLLKSDSE